MRQSIEKTILNTPFLAELIKKDSEAEQVEFLCQSIEETLLKYSNIDTLVSINSTATQKALENRLRELRAGVKLFADNNSVISQIEEFIFKQLALCYDDEYNNADRLALNKLVFISANSVKKYFQSDIDTVAFKEVKELYQFLYPSSVKKHDCRTPLPAKEKEPILLKKSETLKESPEAPETLLEQFFVRNTKEELFVNCQRIAINYPDIVADFIQSKFCNYLDPRTIDQSFFNYDALSKKGNDDFFTPAHFIRNICILIKRRTEIFPASQTTKIDQFINLEIEKCVLNISDNMMKEKFARLCIFCPEHLLDFIVHLDDKIPQTDNNEEDFRNELITKIICLLNLHFFGLNSGAERHLFSNKTDRNSLSYHAIPQDLMAQAIAIKKQNFIRKISNILISSTIQLHNLEKVKIVVSVLRNTLSKESKQQFAKTIMDDLFASCSEKYSVFCYLSCFLDPEKFCERIVEKAGDALHNANDKNLKHWILSLGNQAIRNIKELYSETEAKALTKTLTDSLQLFTMTSKTNSPQLSPQLSRSQSSGSTSSLPSQGGESASSSPTRSEGSTSGSQRSSLSETDLDELVEINLNNN